MFISNTNNRVERIKDNKDELNDFLNEYKPFIASSVASSTGRFVEYGRDEELSIGMLAFVEAIKLFDKSKGNFLSFSQHVIQKRLIDYFRKQRKHQNTLSIHDCKVSDEENNELDLTINKSIENFSTENLNEYRKLELLQLKKELLEWDLSFEDLLEASPKHSKLRELYNQIICFVLCNIEISDIVLKKKYLPISEIEKNTKIPRKKIERGRRYIIASIIILSGDYQYIREYVEWR